MEKLTVTEVAEMLNEKNYNIRSWIEKGEFPNSYKEGEKWIILKKDVEEYIERRSVSKLFVSKRSCKTF